jgi:hypothetical protein
LQEKRKTGKTKGKLKLKGKISVTRDKKRQKKCMTCKNLHIGGWEKTTVIFRRGREYALGRYIDPWYHFFQIMNGYRTEVRRVRHYIGYRNKILSDIQYPTLILMYSCSAMVNRSILDLTAAGSKL